MRSLKPGMASQADWEGETLSAKVSVCRLEMGFG
jgi:hypothetical protein